jgi:ATP-dependent DNA helicase RecG
VSPALDKLGKVLELERRQGCLDQAVIGGLAAFLARWRDEAVREALPDAVVGGVLSALDGYASLTPAERDTRLSATTRLFGSRVERAAIMDTEAPRPDTADAPSSPGAGASVLAVDDPALAAPVTRLRGIGPRLAENLARLGLVTIGDLLLHVPHRYNDFRQLKAISGLRPGEEATVAGTVWDVRTRRLGPGRHLLTVVLADPSGTIGCTFFNQPYLAQQFTQGAGIVVSGRAEVFQGRLTFRAPEWEPLDAELVHTGRLVPVYSLTQGVTQRWLRARIHDAVEAWADRLGDPLPAALRAREGLLSRPDAVRALHGPQSEADVTAGRRRVAFDDLLVLGIWSRQRRRARRAVPALDLSAGEDARATFEQGLPFALTGAQRRCLDEITADLSSGVPMTRLLQGDVGSGKTAVAAGAIVQCVAAGYQAALMAPTEILAEQHLASLMRLLAPLNYRPFEAGTDGDAMAEAGPRIARLVGSMRPAAKAAVAAAVRAGHVELVVGTHALIQEPVAFARLGLAVVDEQHRFGVVQRSDLAARAADVGGAPELSPHVLVMTATPIPRTLALVLNADLDQSVIDALPPGRKPIKTLWLRPNERERAYAYVRRRVDAGEQAYIVCPLVEESETIETRAAVAEYERLSTEVFPDLSMGLLHGRLRPAEKEAVMSAFRAGEIAILVATSVIEVGVDVPNATVMLIDGADRFGLAQLHQFRGRVGRGAADSVCLLLADSPSETAVARLEALTRTADGLILAELDLQMRGPGDYFGLQQSGVVDRFRFARLAGPEVMAQAQRVATTLMVEDPELVRPEHAALAERVASFHAAAERV